MAPPDFYTQVDNMEGCSPTCDAGDLQRTLLEASSQLQTPPIQPLMRPTISELAHYMLELRERQQVFVDFMHTVEQRLDQLFNMSHNNWTPNVRSNTEAPSNVGSADGSSE